MRDKAAILMKRKETVERRSRMKLSQYECKVQSNKLSTEQINRVSQMFREAKWWYNTVVTAENVFTFDYKRKTATVKLKTGAFEERDIALPAQIRQDLLKRVQSATKTLATLRKMRRKVGPVKPVRVVNSIPLRQLGQTYRVKAANKLAIVGIPGKLTVNGLERVPRDAEWANAKLVRRPTGLFVVFVVYENHLPTTPKSVLGCDLGVKTALTFSNGIEVDTALPITPKIRAACRKFSKAKDGSKNRRKRLKELNVVHQKRKNVVKEVRNQILNITRGYAIAVQDDNVHGWQRLWGSRVQSNGVGAIKQGWKINPSSILVDRFRRTTNVCRMCGCRLDLSLADRVVCCPGCGHTEPRDLSASRAIGFLGLQSLPAERRFMPLETKPSTEMLNRLQSLPHITARLVDDRKVGGENRPGSSTER